jgi:serine/threonine protein kinase/membrane protein implicated in regulation of membrane protease activity
MHLMEVKGAKPGQFTPRCASCKRKFALVVPEDAGAAPTVAAMAQPRREEQLHDDITAALGIEKTPVPQLKSKEKKSGGATATASSASASVTTPPPAARSSVSGAPMISVDLKPPTVASMRIPSHADVTIAPGAAAPTVPDRPPQIDLDQVTRADGDGQSHSENGELHGTLGGYHILNRLGQGGMGAVYLARQLSLDRNVAMKVLLEQLAEDPQFIARFTREAYAAAQLTHHNMVQIHDIGAQRRTHFFSMEFVEGQTLAQLVRERGRIDPEVAVGYVLQAARGLKFAHDHGMVHRDVKPENLMLNVHGIVKVADLGLVKTADQKHDEAARAKAAAASGNWYDTQTTQLNISMGTPAYMPPEQATDAANVDHRADIYSLGCTLYTLLVGRPPFVAKTAMEVITKHMKEPITPPSVIDEHVPESLSAILLRMVAKRPQDRYQTMSEVIAALEGFMGTDSAGPFSASEEQVKALESCVSWFNGSSWAKQRTRLIRAFVPLSVLLLAVALFVPAGAAAKIQWAGGVLGFIVLTPLFYLLLSGMTQRTHLMLKVREFVFASRILDWLTWIVGALLVAGVLVALNWHLMWLAFAVAAAIMAALFHFTIDPLVQRQQMDPVLQAEALLKKMRGRAVPEAALQQFVCKYAGEQWEAFYEALFGFEAKLLAREKWGKSSAIGRAGVGDRGRPRPKHAAWREPVLAWIDAKQRARREAKERKLLVNLEHASLKAKGYSETAARKKAARTADTLVMKAAELRADAKSAAMETTPPPPKPEEQKKPDEKPPEQTATAEAARKRKKMLDDEGLEGFEHLSYFQRRYGGWAGLFLGPAVRFSLGAVLLTGCILWVKQNQLFNTDAIAAARQEAATALEGVSGSDATSSAAGVTVTAKPRKPLELRVVPMSMTRYFDGWSPGVAGAILIFSALFSAPSLGLFIVPAGLIMFLGGKFGVPNVGSVSSQSVAMVLGLVVATVGFMFARK